MSVISIGCRGLWNITFAVSVVIALSYTTAAQAATARAAKDAAEQSKAVTAAARYLQGPGFINPMLAAVNIENHLTVQVDRGWVRMNKAQKVTFLERVNGSALSASGGIAMDIQVTVSGAKVAASTFSAGQQTIRLLAE